MPLLQEMDEKTLYLLASKMTPFRWAGLCCTDHGWLPPRPCAGEKIDALLACLYVRASILFRKLPVSQSSSLCCRFTGGHDLVTEGDPADRFWILIEGRLYRELARQVSAPCQG